MDPKNVLKAPWAPIYTNFEWGARAEKKLFFVKIFQKVPKNAFLGLFFLQKMPAAQIIWGQNNASGELEKLFWST